MRIKRTDKNFTAKKKADRRIHYAGQGKKYTKNTVNLSAKEKQDALRQSGYSGARVQGQTYRNSDGGGGEAHYDDIKMCRTDYGSSNGDGSGGVGGGASVAPGNIHAKKPQYREYQEQAVRAGAHNLLYRELDFQDKRLANGSQADQHQTRHQVQPHHPSAYHENTIKTKDTVIHRRSEAPGINRHTDAFIFKGRNFSKKEIHRKQPARGLKIRHGNRVVELRNLRPVGDIPVKGAGEINPASASARSFEDKRGRQISGYKKKKYLGFRKQERMGRNAYAGSDTARKPDTDNKAGTWKTEEKYKPEVYLSQLYQTGEPALSEIKSSLINQQKKDTARLRMRAPGDSIRQRGKGISGQRRQDKAGIMDMDTGRDGGKSRNTKENKKHGNDRKNTKRDPGSKSGAGRRRKRAAILRLLSYSRDKFSQEEQKDSPLKVVKDLLLGKAKAMITGTLLSIGASLLPVLIPAFMITITITILFNSPFSILLPKLTDRPGAVEVLEEYTEDFRETVQEELADPGSGDEMELIYEDYEGDGEPDNMADILMVYMVKHGFGDTATVMTQKNQRLLKDTFDEMTSLNISYRMETVEQSYEEEDFWGNVTIRTEEVEIKIKEVRITLLTSEDIIQTGIFTEEETEILRYLMSPEVLENIEGLTDGYGSPGRSSLTPEEEERLNLGSHTGSQAVKNALARLGKPYSQAKRDSGDYYDCSSLTYYSYKEAGINLSYYGSNTAASQGKLLSDGGCEVNYEDIQPGDLIFYSFTRNGRYKNISHVAVYAGNGYLVDASSSKGCVVFRPVYSVGKIVLCGRPSWL